MRPKQDGILVYISLALAAVAAILSAEPSRDFHQVMRNLALSSELEVYTAAGAIGENPESVASR
jgi:hypothetical protein